ncbi:MAG: nSTAND1 domain-containing NTPase [Streptosporangiaceae bacterium]
MTGDLQADHLAADPDRIATQQDFGQALTELRLAAGLTVRQVARATGLPASTTGDYFSGRHLPGVAAQDQVVSILRACGQENHQVWARWLDALQRARRQPGKRPASAAPYRGLARFERDDALWFFGREDVADRLVALAEQQVPTGQGGDQDPGPGPTGARGLPLVLVGPSGSGKSSVLRAGVLARLTRPVAIFEPTATPRAELLARLAELAVPDGSARPVIIVDQFEALFARCPVESERAAFIAELAELAGRCSIMLALRADFYERALRYPWLAAALQARPVVLGPMTTEQVERAIVQPARLARLDVEDGLVGVLLRDLAPPGASPEAAGPAADARPGPDGGPGTGAAPRGAYEPGALPLLSHAMLSTWEHSRGGLLTVADYLASGGIRDALTRTAESTFAALTLDERELARRAFLHLVHVTDGAPPTRAVVPLGELRTWGGPQAEQVLGRFVDERLITMDSGAAQITHDALLTAWPRLRSWIEAGTADLRTRHRITEAARAWQETGHEAAALWRGSQLAIARDWAADPGNLAAAGTLAAEFLTASVAEDLARERAEQRRTRRLQRLAATLTALTVAVFGLAVYAFQQREHAVSARNGAVAARNGADSRQVALVAGQLRGQDVSIAAQFSRAAYAIARTPQATASLLGSSDLPSAARLPDSSAGAVQSVSFSPDRRLLAVAASDGTLRLWRVADPGHASPAGPPLERAGAFPLYTTAFSPNGRLLAAAGAQGTVALWDLARSGRPVRAVPPLTGSRGTVYSVAFNPAGTVLAAGSGNGTAAGTVRLWRLAGPAGTVAVRSPLAVPGGGVESVAFSPAGPILAAGSANGTVRLWDVANPARPVALGQVLGGPRGMVTSVAFSPDGTMLAAGSRDHKVWLWRIGTAPGGGARATPDGVLTGATDWVNAVAFSPDGTEVAAATSDASVLVWSLASQALAASLPHPQPVTSLAWDGAGRLAAGDGTGYVSVWTLPSPVLLTGSPAYDAVFSPGGGLLAVTTATGLQLWDARTRRLLAGRPTRPPMFANAVAFAPGGRYLAATYSNSEFRLWSADRALRPLSPYLTGSSTGQVECVAFRPDGAVLATGGDDGTVRIWSVSDPAAPRLLAVRHDTSGNVMEIAFAPNGKTLAVTSTNSGTRIWEVADPARPRPIGGPLGNPTGFTIAVAYSPDGHLLAVGGAAKTIQLWNVTNPARPVAVGAPLGGPASDIYGLAFSPDGTALAAAADTDNDVWLWNVARPAHPSLIATLTGPGDHVYAVDFAPAGHLLVAPSADGTVHLWNTDPAAVAAAICAGAGQPLTRQEWATYVPGVAYRPACGGR